MKKLLKLEDIFYFLLALVLFSELDYSWGLFLLVFFIPDISMIGYLQGPKYGAYLYNGIHHKAVAIGVYIFGIYIGDPVYQMAGLVLLAHSSFDRVFGYGLKYTDSFTNTHLGKIGKKEKQNHIKDL